MGRLDTAKKLFLEKVDEHRKFNDVTPVVGEMADTTSLT